MICQKCNKAFPITVIIEGKTRNLCNRKHCLDCQPFGRRQQLIRHKPVECPKHGFVEFAVNSKGHFRCKKCRSEAVTKARQRRKLELVELLGGCCEICGYGRCVGALHFHHLDPKTKRYSIAQKGACRSWEDMVEEIDKCILVCANCHAEIENGVIDSPVR